MWFLYWGTELLRASSGCGNDCEEAFGVVIIWTLGELLLLPVLLLTSGAVVSDGQRRRCGYSWPGYVALAVPVALWAFFIVVACVRALA